MEFRKAKESLCADDGAERDRTYSKLLLPSIACFSISLLTTESE